MSTTTTSGVRVPLSPTPPPLPVPPSSPSLVLQSAASFRIRAPVTADSDSSDFDSDVSSDDLSPVVTHQPLPTTTTTPDSQYPKALVMPVAQLSFDDDEDQDLDFSDEENSAVPTVVRVPTLDKYKGNALVKSFVFSDDTEDDTDGNESAAQPTHNVLDSAQLNASSSYDSREEDYSAVAAEDVVKVEHFEVEEIEAQNHPVESSGDNDLDQNQRDDAVDEEEESRSIVSVAVADADAGSATRPNLNVEFHENGQIEEEDYFEGKTKLLLPDADLQGLAIGGGFEVCSDSQTNSGQMIADMMKVGTEMELQGNGQIETSEEGQFDFEGKTELLPPDADLQDLTTGGGLEVCSDSQTNTDMMKVGTEMELEENGQIENSEEVHFDFEGKTKLLSPDADLDDLTIGGGLEVCSDSQTNSGQMIADMLKVGTEIELQENDLYDSAVVASSLAESEGSSFTVTSGDESRQVSTDWSADTGSSSFRRIIPPPLDSNGDFIVKFLRIIHRLEYSPQHPIAAQVMYGLVGEGYGSQELSFESADRMAMELQEEGKDDVDFCLNILVIGKTGVGKSSTINSIFGEKKVVTSAYEPATSYVKEVCGSVSGIPVRIFDTPGLRLSANRKILDSVKKLTKKFPPDVVLYIDRLDDLSSDQTDVTLLSEVTKSLTSSIWENAIVVLTHASSLPPEGPSGSPISFEEFVTRRCNVVHQAFSLAVGRTRPVALAENHQQMSSFNWNAQLLLICCSVKILSEAKSAAKKVEADKTQFNVHFDSSVGGRNGSTMAGMEIQTIGEHVKVKNLKVNKTAAGMSVAIVGGEMATGMRIEDEIAVGKLLSGAEIACETKMEIRAKSEDHHLAAEEEGDSRLTVSVMRCIGTRSKMDIGGWMNTKRRGKIIIKTSSSSSNLQIAVMCLVPLAMAVLRSIFPGMAAPVP